MEHDPEAVETLTAPLFESLTRRAAPGIDTLSFCAENRLGRRGYRARPAVPPNPTP